MGYPPPSCAIEQHLGASRGEQHSYPVGPPPREANVVQDFEEERPGHGVKCFGNVDLQQQGRLTFTVQPTTCHLYSPKVVMDRPSSDERALVYCDHFLQPGRQPPGQALSKQFAEAMYQAYRPVVLQMRGVFFFAQQYHDCLV